MQFAGLLRADDLRVRLVDLHGQVLPPASVAEDMPAS
jgi:hypothetical protein